MKNTFPPFAKIIAVAACALTLGSCSRAEYAMLPKGGSYHGVNRAATPVPAQPEATAAVTPAATPEAAATVTVAATPAPAAAPATAAAPAPKAEAAAKKVAVAPAAAVATQTNQAVATTTPKLNAMQRLALNKVTRRMDKLMQHSATARQHDNTASTTKTSAISGNLRTGIILVLIGLIVGIFSPLIGTIIALIGVIFLVLWLLDNL
ncbi:hypothetical protein AUC43_10460 [Hymenobacter sedentarius]|uniref:Translation initiation factor 2 n=1 Tax=Hymenobacter sedentarius TaxID=1411621 RepID=A0A0U4CBC6_9BACT|nr:hypothetical protein [Hymenobacter sedentarius]ALW85481.1 hypothetical protein AUC43_10460 [Hymenobacter sedentarius]